MVSPYHARTHSNCFSSPFRITTKKKSYQFRLKANIHIKLMVATIILAFSTLIITFQIISPILDYGEFSLMVSPT